MTRYKLRDRMRDGRYWEDEKKKGCRVCERREETWEHVCSDREKKYIAGDNRSDTGRQERKEN